ncbi:ribonuclease HII [Candidatus Uhrbacteria bacterium]|nr:ribonuclease HII [Candidatus Uhrbacteria bacterium]
MSIGGRSHCGAVSWEHMRPPTFTHERALAHGGYAAIGVDEAGCGCLAGPVVAAAAYLPMDSRLGNIRDSKLLSAAQRERLVVEFDARGFRYAIGVATHEEVDRVNIRQATYLAMRRAVEGFLDVVSLRAAAKQSRPTTQTTEIASSLLVPRNDTSTEANWHALVDAWTIPNLSSPQRGIIHGDRLVKSIAAASIIAKVTRDRMMDVLDREFPHYGFAQHKGYATVAHRAAIAAHGVSPVHRRTFTVRI